MLKFKSRKKFISPVGFLSKINSFVAQVIKI